MKLSRYFTLDELTHSNTAKAARIDNQPGEGEVKHLTALCTTILDPLRDAVGRPIKVSSGYRGPALNQRIGGVKKSQHMTGQAADIQSPGTAVLELFKTVIRLKLPFDQIIYEVKGSSKWVHVSYDPVAPRGAILLAKFGADGKVTYPPITAQQALEMTEPVTRGMGFTDEQEYEETADEPEYEAPMARGLREVAPAAARARIAKTPIARKTRAPKKAATRRPAAKKAAAKRAAAKRAAAKRTVAKKAVKKTVAKKAVKKAVAKKAVKKAVSKAAAKRVVAKKAAAKKSTARKALPKSANAKKSARSRTTKPAVAASGKRAAARRGG